MLTPSPPGLPMKNTLKILKGFRRRPKQAAEPSDKQATPPRDKMRRPPKNK